MTGYRFHFFGPPNFETSAGESIAIRSRKGVGLLACLALADGKPVLKLKMLLHAGLVPGQKIKVESETISGVFRLEAVTHNGDTFTNDFYTEIEAKPV